MGKTLFQDATSPGTIVTAAFLNSMQNHRHTGLDADGSCPIDGGLSTGSSNVYALTLSPAMTAYTNYLPIVFKANFTNSGSATLNINSLGAKTLKKNFNQNLAADDIQSGQIVIAIYDGTNFQVFLLKNTFFYAADTGSANAYAAAFSPALTAHVVGLTLCFKASNANTGASTLAVNSLSAKAIKRLDGTALQSGDIPNGSMITVAYDGTYYQLLTVQKTFFYAADTGSANAYAATYAPALTAHVVGLPLCFKASHANTGASTFNPGPGAVAIKRLDGTALQSGDIPNDGMITVAYDGTYYQLLFSQKTFFYAADTGSANAYAATYAPALTAHVVGLPLCFKASHANTGASTFNPGPGAVAIKRLDGTALQSGDIPNGGMITVAYDGTYYQLQSTLAILPTLVTGSAADLTMTLSLTPGTWMIVAYFRLHQAGFAPMTLTIDSVLVDATPNLGDEVGTSYISMMGATSVVKTTTSSITISAAGDNNYSSSRKIFAVAIKTA